MSLLIQIIQFVMTLTEGVSGAFAIYEFKKHFIDKPLHMGSYIQLCFTIWRLGYVLNIGIFISELIFIVENIKNSGCRCDDKLPTGGKLNKCMKKWNYANFLFSFLFDLPVSLGKIFIAYHSPDMEELLQTPTEKTTGLVGFVFSVVQIILMGIQLTWYWRKTSSRCNCSSQWYMFCILCTYVSAAMALVSLLISSDNFLIVHHDPSASASLFWFIFLAFVIWIINLAVLCCCANK